MSLFRGSKNATVVEGRIVATTQDVVDALNDAVSAKNAAELAESGAINTLEDFETKYLGAKTSDPTQNNDGGLLIDGALYYNTTDNITKVYDETFNVWLKVSPSDQEQNNIDTVLAIADDISSVANIDTDVSTVANDITNVNIVAGISSDVTSVSNISSDVTTAATNVADISTVATDITSVTTVATDISDVIFVSENIEDVRTAAQASEDAANARDKAEEWASNPEDVEVEPGLFSSFHYAQKSEDSANAASTSESNALTSENNASNSASAALTSEQNASDSADAAAISESNALTSEQNAANTFDDFDDRYLGPKSSAPTTDNDGDPLQIGALYFDTTSNTMQVFSSTGFVPAGSSVNGTSDRFKYTATSGQTAFTGADDDGNSLTYDSGFLDVYLNGVRLINGTDFTATTGTSIDLASGAGAGDVLSVVAFGTFALADHYTKTESDNRYLRPDTVEPTFTGTAALGIPTGTTAERPATSAVGQMRFNTDTGSFEGYDGVAWETIGETVPLILKPSPVSPSDGATDIGETPTLNGGGFFSLYGRSHALSRFQVSDDDQFNNIVYDTGEIAATTTTTIPEGTLQSGETTYYWRVYYEDDNGTESEYSDTQSFTTANFFGLDATGGTVTDITDGGVNYRVHTFTSSGTFDVQGGGEVEYLVVAGGGAGGSHGNPGGGGGAGGYRISVIGEPSGGGSSHETPIGVTAGAYTVTVGAGGTSTGDGTDATNGNDSSIIASTNITSLGGGRGSTGSKDGSSGGSGGGANYQVASGGSGTSGQGFDGGDGPGFNGNYATAGGGGAGGVGGNGDNNSAAGDGGAGLQSSITGTAVFRAGGGGGASYQSLPSGSGGNGGGGDGGTEFVVGTNGTTNTGGGGGGGSFDAGTGNGGSGIVIIRYQI